MQTLLVVNGENYWQDFLPGFRVEQKKLQSTEWLLKENKLYALDANGVCQPDKILWRVGAIRPEAKHRTALEFIRLSGIACINPAETLLIGYDRLSILQAMRACNLPVIPFHAVTSSTQLKNIALPFPFVVKAGNFHGGFGKVLVDSEAKWQDTMDLLFITQEYVTVEPYIAYERDIRYLAIGDQVWAMARRGKFWKANVETTDFVLIDPEETLVEQTKLLQHYLKADILAIDILEETNGTRWFVEYNDIPGFSGFPDVVREKVARIVEEKLPA